MNGPHLTVPYHVVVVLTFGIKTQFYKNEFYLNTLHHFNKDEQLVKFRLNL